MFYDFQQNGGYISIPSKSSQPSITTTNRFATSSTQQSSIEPSTSQSTTNRFATSSTQPSTSTTSNRFATSSTQPSTTTNRFATSSTQPSTTTTSNRFATSSTQPSTTSNRFAVQSKQIPEIPKLIPNFEFYKIINNSINGQFLRIENNTNFINISEIILFDENDDLIPVEGSNVKLSSVNSNNNIYDGSSLVDYNLNTFSYTGDGENKINFIEVDLTKNYNISRFIIFNKTGEFSDIIRICKIINWPPGDNITLM